jgi:hypothetical protein
MRMGLLIGLIYGGGVLGSAEDDVFSLSAKTRALF